MGMFDTIEKEIEVDVKGLGTITISDWQTKAMGKHMNTYPSGHEILRRYRKIPVIGSVVTYVRGDLIINEKGEVIDFHKERETSK